MPEPAEYPCCDCCLGDDDDDCDGHDAPCDIHQLPAAERDPSAWLRP